MPKINLTQTVEERALAFRKEKYLTMMRKRLSLVARRAYNSTYGGADAIDEYRTRCYRIRKIKSLGEMLVVAHDMGLDVPTTVKLALQPFLAVTSDDFINAPEKWD